VLCCRQLFYFNPIDRLEKYITRRKVAVQCSWPNLCLFGDVVQAGVRAGAGERLLGHLQNALAITLRISARLSPNGLRTFCHQKILQPEIASGYPIYGFGDTLRFIETAAARQDP
jgi:hypothetical protein